MITNKKELKFYIQADYIMNHSISKHHPQIDRIRRIIFKDYILQFLIHLRYEEYYINTRKKIFFLINHYKLKQLGIKLGFSIAPNVLGYGVVIPHYGTIVVGAGNTIGNYCVLHTSTCINAGKKMIGDAFYVSTGAKIIKDISVENGCSVCANSLLNHDVYEENVTVGGIPAIVIKHSQPWYIRDGEEYRDKVRLVEELKDRMF